MTPTPKGLYIVRGIEKEQYWDGSPVKSDRPFRMEGIFPSREQAEAFQSEMESKAAASGDPGPLLDVGGLEGLMALSAFEPGVFRDFLIDHGISDPDTYESKRRVTSGGWDWLVEMSPEHLAALYAALHHFRFYEIVEVPFVFGDYLPEQWEEWEKTLPP